MNNSVGKIIAALLGVLTTGVFLLASLLLQRMEFHERTLERHDDRLRNLEAISARMSALQDDVSVIMRDVDYLRKRLETVVPRSNGK